MGFYLIGPLVTLIPLGSISTWAFKPYCDDGLLGISPTAARSARRRAAAARSARRPGGRAGARDDGGQADERSQGRRRRITRKGHEEEEG